MLFYMFHWCVFLKFARLVTVCGMLFQGKNTGYYNAIISTFVEYIYVHYCNVYNAAVRDDRNCI
jgi:hypothetical protein